MVSYTAPSFQDRTARSADAKKKALDQLRAKPPVDQALVAERQRARGLKDAADAARRADKAAVRRQDRLGKVEAAARSKIDILEVISDAEAGLQKKAERDARYAARKSRK